MAGTPYTEIDAALPVVPLPLLNWTDVAVVLARPTRTLLELNKFQSQPGQRVRRRQPNSLADQPQPYRVCDVETDHTRTCARTQITFVFITARHTWVLSCMAGLGSSACLGPRPAGIFPAGDRYAMRPPAWKSIAVGRVKERKGIVPSRLLLRPLVTLQKADNEYCKRALVSRARSFDGGLPPWESCFVPLPLRRALPPSAVSADDDSASGIGDVPCTEETQCDRL